jgi:hypothetical protein
MLVLAVSVDITARVHIGRGPVAVAAYMTDPANDPAWIGGLREVELLGEAPYRFEPAAGGGTTVSNHVRGGGPRVFAPLVRRNVQRDLNRLRDVLDA